MKLGKAIWKTAGSSTKGLVFSPAGDLLVQSEEGAWWTFNPRRKESRKLSLKGRAAFFGTWATFYDATRDGSATIAWPDEGTQQACGLGFDESNNQDTPLVATADRLSAIVRRGELWIRPGAPSTVHDGLGWTRVVEGGFSSNLRLLCTSDARFVIGTNLDTFIDVYDVVDKRRFQIRLCGMGHPAWAAVHPTQHRVAVSSRGLDIIDLDDRRARFVLQLPAHFGGEFLPDGKLLFSTQLGLMTLDENLTIRYEAAFKHHDINRPLRLFPDGKHAVLGRKGELTVHAIQL